MKLVSIIDGWTVDMIFNSFIILSQLIWLMFTNTNPPPPYFDMWQESTHICAKSSGRTITFHALQCYKGFRASAAPKLGVPIWMMFTNTQTHIRPPLKGLWQESTHRARFAEDDINSSWLDSPVETHNCVQVYYWLWAMSIFGSYPCYLRIFFPVIFSQVRSQKSSFIGKTPNYWGGEGFEILYILNSVPFGPKQSTFLAKIRFLSPTFRGGGAGATDLGLLPKKGLYCGPSFLWHLYCQSKKYSTSC